MRLDELKPSHAKEIHKGVYKYPGEIIERLEELGYEKIGQGYYSSVWQMPGSKGVVKVSKRSDYCWLKFAQLAKENKNPHFPKITTLKKLDVEDNTTYFIAIMEDLEPISFDDSVIINYLIRIVDKLSSTNPDEIVEKAKKVYDNWRDIEEIMKEYPKLPEACQLLIDNQGSCKRDLSTDNIMMRGVTPVFVDPWSSTYYE